MKLFRLERTKGDKLAEVSIQKFIRSWTERLRVSQGGVIRARNAIQAEASSARLAFNGQLAKVFPKFTAS